MMRMLLVRGMLSGLVAGLLAVVFARLFGEPSVVAAIGFESAMQAATGEAAAPDLVSRGAQSTVGLATGMLVYSVASGGLFALAFAVASGRIGAAIRAGDGRSRRAGRLPGGRGGAVREVPC